MRVSPGRSGRWPLQADQACSKRRGGRVLHPPSQGHVLCSTRRKRSKCPPSGMVDNDRCGVQAGQASETLCDNGFVPYVLCSELWCLGPGRLPIPQCPPLLPCLMIMEAGGWSWANRKPPGRSFFTLVQYCHSRDGVRAVDQTQVRGIRCCNHVGRVIFHSGKRLLVSTNLFPQRSSAVHL